jgi:hypothetical protein
MINKNKKMHKNSQHEIRLMTVKTENMKRNILKIWIMDVKNRMQFTGEVE